MGMANTLEWTKSNVGKYFALYGVEYDHEESHPVITASADYTAAKVGSVWVLKHKTWRRGGETTTRFIGTYPTLKEAKRNADYDRKAQA